MKTKRTQKIEGALKKLREIHAQNSSVAYMELSALLPPAQYSDEQIIKVLDTIEEEGIPIVVDDVDNLCERAEELLFSPDSDQYQKREGFDLLKLSSEGGYIPAFYFIGLCFWGGVAVEMNRKEALRWFNKAAKKGQSDAMVRLGECYYLGLSTRKNKNKAFELFDKAARLKNLNAFKGLGWCYENGIGCPEDPSKAVKCFKIATQAYRRDVLNLTPSEKNGYRVEHYSRCLLAEYRLGEAYINGNGIKKNRSLGMKWLKCASETDKDPLYPKGHVMALYSLGNMYFYGSFVEKNMALAKHYYVRAAEQGYPGGIYMLEEFFNTKPKKKWIELCEDIYGSY